MITIFYVPPPRFLHHVSLSFLLALLWGYVCFSLFSSSLYPLFLPPLGPTTNFFTTTTKTPEETLNMKVLSSVLLVVIAGVADAFTFHHGRQQRSATTALNGVLTKETGRSSLDPAVIARYDSLPFPPDTILAEYVWVDAVGNTRSKTRTLPASKGESVDKLPKWNFDGSSTGQAPGDDSEVILRPCRIFKDPFRPRNDGLYNILVMCDTWTPAGQPLPTNSRAIGTFYHSSFRFLFDGPTDWRVRQVCRVSYLFSLDSWM